MYGNAAINVAKPIEVDDRVLNEGDLAVYSEHHLSLLLRLTLLKSRDRSLDGDNNGNLSQTGPRLGIESFIEGFHSRNNGNHMIRRHGRILS